MKILPTYLVRMSGFSFRRLEKLRFSRTIVELASSRDAREALQRELEALVRKIEGSEGDLRKEARKLRYFARELHAFPETALAKIEEALPELDVTPVRNAHRRLTDSQDRVDTVFEAELERARDLLREELADPRLREAVFLESADAYAAIARLGPSPRNSKIKRVEDTAMMYLQRFAAKNDTNSLCGPFGMARFSDERGSGRLAIAEELAARRTYFSHWAARALLGERSVRRNPASRVEGDSLYFCRIDHDATTFIERSYRRARLTEQLRAVWEATAEPRLASELGLEEEDLEVLIDAGILLEGSLPFGVFDPLPADSPVRPHVDAFARGDLETRVESMSRLESLFEELTGESPRRAAGRHYADRGLLHEDCFTEVEADLGIEITEPLLEAIEPLVRTSMLPLERARDASLAWFRSQFGEDRFVSVLEAHQAFDRDRPHEAGGTSESIERVRRIIGDAIALCEGGTARVDPALLREAAPPPRSGYASADVMLLPPGESPRIILGEMHGFFLLVTSWFDVAPPSLREGALEEMSAVLRELSGGKRTAEALLDHTQATDRRFPIADLDLEIIGKSPRARVELGELEVGFSGGSIRFRRAGGEELVPFMAHGGYPFFTYLGPLAPLIDEYRGKFFPSELLPDDVREGDAPRLVAGDVIFRRAVWNRSASELVRALDAKRDSDLFARAQALRERLGCPRFLFAGIEGEPKPILVDFDDFLLLEVLIKRVRGLAPEARIKLSEMLPAPEHLWLEGHDGPRTFELRVGVYHDETANGFGS